MALAELCRSMRGITLTDIDAMICADRGAEEDYKNTIADRNDAAIMLARTALASAGCRATRNRVMPAGESDNG